VLGGKRLFAVLPRCVKNLAASWWASRARATLRFVPRDELKSLGADEVVPFSPDGDNADRFCERIMAITGPEGVRFAIEPVGGATGSAVARCLGQNGRMLAYGTLSGDPVCVSPRELIGTGASIEGFWLANWTARQSLINRLRLVSRVKRLMRQGILVSDVGKRYSLDQIADAVREAERPGRGGKTLLQIADA